MPCLDNSGGGIVVTVVGNGTGGGTLWVALLVDSGITIVVLDGKAKTSGVDVLVAPEEKSTEDRLG
jgi:hypothetical protein